MKVVSPLPIQFLPEIVEEKEERERRERREKKDAISKDETWIWLFLSLHLTSTQLNVC